MKASIAYTRVIELRKGKRYRLSVPVSFFWGPHNGPPQSGKGTTRDVNTTGVYVDADEMPQVGALVQMDIMLPNPVHDGPGSCLTGEGVVLRVDQRVATSSGINEGGFAASLQLYPEPSEVILSYFPSSGPVM